MGSPSYLSQGKDPAHHGQGVRLKVGSEQIYMSQQYVEVPSSMVLSREFGIFSLLLTPEIENHRHGGLDCGGSMSLKRRAQPKLLR